MNIKQTFLTLLGIAAVILVSYRLAVYFAVLEPPQVRPGESVVIQAGEKENGEGTGPVTFDIELVASGMRVPWSIVFPGENRLYVAERPGRIRVIENGELQREPYAIISAVSSQAEEGLMGLALDPFYIEEPYLYACYAYRANGGFAARVVRLTDTGEGLEDELILLDNIPAAQYHAGCRLSFGPDNKLYVTTGDATDRTIAQQLDSLGGKTLRMNRDGSIPEDNPFEDSYVYSYGHRNAQGLAWHPESGALLSTEHGPSIFDGPAGGDEVNHVMAGANYGWPLVSHEESMDGAVDPLFVFTPAVAPASAMIYSGDAFPQWYGDLFFGGLRGEGIYHVTFTDNTATTVSSVEQLGISLGRIREVTQGPDGAIYFSTSNRDGRGNVSQTDDAIYKITPTNQ